MQENNHDNRRKAGARATGPAAGTEKPVYTAGQRETVQTGLRIPARMIARAHLGRRSLSNVGHSVRAGRDAPAHPRPFWGSLPARSRWLTLTSDVGNDAADPNRCEVNDMTLIPEPRLDTDAQSHTTNERICETTPEETDRRGPAGTPGNQGPPAGRRQNESRHSPPPGSGRGCTRGCASWPG